MEKYVILDLVNIRFILSHLLYIIYGVFTALRICNETVVTF